MWRFERYSERKKRKYLFSTTPLSFDAPSPANPREYLHNIKLILLETRIPGLHFCCWQYGSIFMQILVVGSETHMCNATECRNAVQGHFRVNQGRWFWYQSKARIYDFTLVINSNLCRISHRFKDTAAYWSKIAVPSPPSFNALARGDPLRILRWAWYPQKLEWWCYHMVKKSWS